MWSGRREVYAFASLQEFLTNYHPWNPINLAGCVGPGTHFVNHLAPVQVLPWDGFEATCRKLIAAVPNGGPVKIAVPKGTTVPLGSERNVQDELNGRLVRPLVEACSANGPAFMLQGVRGSLKCLNGSPDDLFVDAECKEVLVPIEYKTSRALNVPSGDLVATYASATARSGAKEAVHQMAGYLAEVTYGALITDRQLFCFRREGSTLHISAAVPVTGDPHCPPAPSPGRVGSDATRGAEQAAADAAEQRLSQKGHGPAAPSAVGALFCLATLAGQQRSMRQASDAASGGGRGSRSASPGGAARRPSVGGAAVPLQGLAAALTPTPLAAVSEGSFESSDVFGPGFMYKQFLAEGRTGRVLTGVIGGQPAAVKVADLYKQPEARAEMQIEVEIYRRLRSLQGVHIPRLLAYGYIDGWQYFVATSLERPSLESNETWPEDEAATIMSAIRALDKVRRDGLWAAVCGDGCMHI
ncbi:hypothetical protein GPECTOR_6g482 [Gonium pectorale]|uniref:Protein kinase domain-containing protein n=1 Tax=Gonium pectorale TaxID=33097 RepID=A0A150GUM2_GONPE|nr:hypothetical protein GPECTOR_6g482 [Gonium pectorale]|eukprot:KXZ53565.1 hypothetical protein GPECTOR_6g482 [Gonium pectorale]